MPWELRLAFALLFVVISVLTTTWCMVRLKHYPEGLPHVMYALASSAALISVLCAALFALTIILEKTR